MLHIAINDTFEEKKLKYGWDYERKNLKWDVLSYERITKRSFYFIGKSIDIVFWAT